MSDQVLDVLESDYDNIEGYETTIDDYDLHSIFVKDIQVYVRQQMFL